jgi:hypothetical protein
MEATKNKNHSHQSSGSFKTNLSPEWNHPQKIKLHSKNIDIAANRRLFKNEKASSMTT